MTQHIRFLSPDEYPTIRDIRLQALREAPDAFGDTYARASGGSDADWSAWTQASVVPERKQILCAEDEVKVVAMCGFGISDNDSSIGFLWGMFVSSGCRRRGVGHRLLLEAERWLAARDVICLTACVAAPNQVAIRFYERCGYTIGPASGTLRPGSEIPVYPIKKKLMKSAKP